MILLQPGQCYDPIGTGKTLFTKAYTTNTPFQLVEHRFEFVQRQVMLSPLDAMDGCVRQADFLRKLRAGKAASFPFQELRKLPFEMSRHWASMAKTPSENLQIDNERLIRRLLGKANNAEALDWLKGGTRAGRRTLGEFKDLQPATALVKRLYRAGAGEVFAVDIKSDAKGNQHTGKLVVALPEDIRAREAIFQWCKAQGEALGFSPEQDGDEEYLFLLLD